MRKYKPKIREWLRSIIEICFVGLATYLFFSYIIVWGHVPSSSMAPTIMPGDIVISNALAYLHKEPQRGDIILFEGYINGKKESLVKRVIGIPGDDVMFIEGKVYINGKLIEETYIPNEVQTDCEKDFFEIPQDNYFVMGDNRTNSYDSRYWEEPYVERKDIKGKLIVIINTSNIYYFQNKKSWKNTLIKNY